MDQTNRRTNIPVLLFWCGRDYARIDLRMKNDLYYVLDVNPNADFSPDTSLVYTAEEAGLSYGVMASCLVNLAAQRHPLFSQKT